MNRRGATAGEQTMVLWFIFLLILIFGTLAMGAALFYGPGFDTRASESSVLNHEIRECISQNSVAWESPDSFYSTCRLSRKVLFEQLQQKQIIIKICSPDCASGNVLFRLGSNFEACDFLGKNEKFAQCTDMFATNNTASYEIITGSNHQTEQENG